MTAAPSTSPPTTTPAADATPAPVTEVDVRNLQDKFNTLLNQRNAHNDLAKAAREERDLLNEGRRAKSADIKPLSAARDAANEVANVHRQARDQYQEQAKALIAEKKGKSGAVEKSLPLMVRKLRNELQAMIEQQQTTTLTVAKERVLVEKISETWKSLKEKEAELQKQKAVQVDLSETDGSIDALFAKADEEHEKYVAARATANEAHGKLVGIFKELRVLEAESDKKHNEFIAHKQKADEFHNKGMELREKVMSIRGERKAQFDAERKEIRDVNQTARRNVSDPKAVERHNDSLLEQMKKGGKITLGF
jgi:uncharacterized coiled-coil DUF342 family protein